MNKWKIIIRYAIFKMGIVEDGKKLIECAEYSFDPNDDNCYDRLLDRYRKEVVEHNGGE